MASRGRLWHVLNAGLQATPTDAVGDKRTRDEADEADEADETPPVSESEQSEESADFDLLATNMRLTMPLTPTWQPEHRDFSAPVEYSNIPLVRYDSRWDIPEFSMTQNNAARAVELTGTLDEIFVQLQKGSSDRPPSFSARHFLIHLTACQAALFKKPELVNNLDDKFRPYVDGDNQSLLSLIFVYNAVSAETGRTPIVDANVLNNMGLSDKEIYRFWHQARSLLTDLMESSAVSREVGESDTRLNVADFVSNMIVELDPRTPARSFGGAQQMH
jgi:hypothetical protein